ncbi:MAG: hypothetical protein R6U13_07750 [Desulfatiglandaceae bacterium]
MNPKDGSSNQGIVGAVSLPRLVRTADVLWNLRELAWFGLHACVCRIQEGEPTTPGQHPWRWAGPEDLLRFPFAEVDRKIMRAFSLT